MILKMVLDTVGVILVQDILLLPPGIPLLAPVIPYQVPATPYQVRDIPLVVWVTPQVEFQVTHQVIRKEVQTDTTLEVSTASAAPKAPVK